MCGIDVQLIKVCRVIDTRTEPCAAPHIINAQPLVPLGVSPIVSLNQTKLKSQEFLNTKYQFIESGKLPRVRSRCADRQTGIKSKGARLFERVFVLLGE